MEQDQEVSTEEPELNDRSVTVRALRPETKSLLSALLNPHKIIPSEKRYPRDWRGLAELCGIPGEKIPNLASVGDPSEKILKIWAEENDNSTIDILLGYLEELDRFDVIDDITPLIEQDIEVFRRNPTGFVAEPLHIDDQDILTIDDISRKAQGLSPQIYDAFVLFDVKDINFSSELIDTMEKQYNLKLCVKDRDLVGGIFEHESIVQLISNRCRRLVVVLSDEFFQSSLNKFFCSFAQVQGIEQQRRKIIPCIYKPCKRMPPELGIYFLLDFERSSKFFNFWDRLHRSIVAPKAVAAVEPPIKPQVKISKPVKTNHVKFITSENHIPKEPIQEEEETPPENNCVEISEETITPSSSCTSLEPAAAEIRKSKSLFKKFKNIFHPKIGSRIAESQEATTNCNGFVDKPKKKSWKPLKMKVAVAN